MHGADSPFRSMVAIRGFARLNGMYATFRSARSSLYESLRISGHATSHCRHPVQFSAMTKRGSFVSPILNPSGVFSIESTEVLSDRVIERLRAVSDILGVVMHAAQSSVGNTLLSWIMCPPIDSARSTSSTLRPVDARFRAVSCPAMPPPTTVTSKVFSSVAELMLPSRQVRPVFL